MLNYQTPLDLAFQALADPTRRAIVERLADRPASVSELKKVYEDMGSSIGHRVQSREVTQWYAGAALLFGLCAAAMSLLWTSRLP